MRPSFFFSGALLFLAIAGCSTAEAPETSVGALTTARAEQCTAEQQALVVRAKLHAPLLPLRSVAGLELIDAQSGSPTTLDMAEAVLCQSTPEGEDERTITKSWGAAQEVVLQFGKESRELRYFQVGLGYMGKLTFESRPVSLVDPTKPNPFGQHRYEIGVGTPVLRDGQTWELNWKKPCTTGESDCWEKQATELFDALMYTFAPGQPSTQESCVAAQSCIGRTLATGGAIFGARPLAIYLSVEDVTLAQPAPSTPAMLYGFARPATAPTP